MYYMYVYTYKEIDIYRHIDIYICVSITMGNSKKACS